MSNVKAIGYKQISFHTDILGALITAAAYFPHGDFSGTCRSLGSNYEEMSSLAWLIDMLLSYQVK